MGEARYLKFLGAGITLWLILFLGFTWLIDPYRISPVQYDVEGFNRYKPKRQDIDRVLKPYEVWKNAPRSLLLGTSRIHQSMDPSVLDGTRFAPAYNASIPASSLELNVSHLRKYLRIDPELKFVLVELNFYNFIYKRSEVGHDGWLNFLSDAGALFLSGDVLWAGIQTLFYNAETNQPCTEIRPGGYIDYPHRRLYSPTDQYYATFLKFPTASGIWAFHALLIQPSDHFELQESAFQAVEEMVRICKAHGVKPFFVITPSHALSNYYLAYFGGLELQVEWLQRLTAMADVYTFPFYSEVEFGPIRYGFRYWYDPMHFTLEIGRQMLNSFALSSIDLGPVSDRFVTRLTEDEVKPYIARYQDTLRQWAGQNPEFTAAFEAGRREWELKNRPGDR